MSDRSYFDYLNKIIQGASARFLSDIEAWRKQHFSGLRNLVEEVDNMKQDEWRQLMSTWLSIAKIPLGEDGKITNNLYNWKYKTYLWMSKLKNEFVGLVYQRHKKTSEKIDIFKQLGLGLMIPSAIEKIMKNINALAVQLHKIEIKNEANHDAALELRTKIEYYFEKLEEEMNKAELAIDLTTGNPEKQQLIDKSDSLQYIIDDIASAMNLANTYFDWASHETYIQEVVIYLDKLQSLIDEYNSPYPSNRPQE